MNTSFSYLTLISQWTGLKPFKVLSSAAERGREQTFWLVYNTRDQMEKGRKGGQNTLIDSLIQKIKLL
ncbi:MAG TPA: hypothetical protein DCR00_12170 [Gammaproteobacteria bacterium]|nr:hypothetical protein [Gammaproteobacteria bacterium]HAW02695.1 hypothetical protein [Verrucomicrobiales bacterium]